MSHGPPVVCIGNSFAEDAAPHLAMPAIWLAHRGFPVRYVGIGDGGEREVATPLGKVPATFVGGSRIGRQAGLVGAIRRARSAGGENAVFIVLGSPLTLAARLALLGLPARRLIYYTQDYLEPTRHPYWRACERSLARASGAVVCNDPHRARFMASDYRLACPALVVPTTLPAAWPQSRRDPALRAEVLAPLGLADSSRLKLIMAGGPYAPERCGPAVLAALTALPDDYVLVFTNSPVGSAWHRAAAAAASAAGLSRRVAIRDRLPFHRLLELTASCDVGLLLYPDDGIGNFCQCPGRLGEYVASGIPVVASRFPSLELAALRWRIGETCDPTSPTAIAAAVARACAAEGEDPHARAARLAATARGEMAYDIGAAALERLVLEAGAA